MKKGCWINLNCQAMTGYREEECPNHENCKQIGAINLSQTTLNPACDLPYHVTESLTHRELWVGTINDPEAVIAGWCRGCRFPYWCEPGLLVVSELAKQTYPTLDKQAAKYGYASAIPLPYVVRFEPKILKVHTDLFNFQRKAGWESAMRLPYKYYLEEKSLIVYFDKHAKEYKDAIALGWYPAESI
jgi:hypothetical protein